MINVPLPNKEAREEIFKIHSKNMTLDKDVDIKEIIEKMDEFSGAEINAVCTEAGYFAIRTNRFKITNKDFLEAIEKVRQEEKFEGNDYLGMFG